MAWTSQIANGKVFQGLGVSKELLDILSRHVLFLFNERLSLWRARKSCEEVCFNGVTEKSVLSFPTVVVHAIPEYGEIYIVLLLGLHEEQVLLVVSMSVDKSDHGVDNLRPLLLGDGVVLHHI